MLVVFTFCVSCSNGEEVDRGAGDMAKIPAEAVYPLQSPADLDILLEEIGDRKIVLLGEASHGTSEFYTWRANLTKRLISEKGFVLVAVEADWADAYPINNYIRGNSNYPSAEAAFSNFDRWPEWMWANEEVRELTEWMKNYNSLKPGDEQVGFYGIDVYGIWESLNIVHQYLQEKDPAAAEISGEVIECFAPYNEDEWLYARAAQNISKSCEDELASLLQVMEQHFEKEPGGRAFNILQNTRVVVNAEDYFRTAVNNDAESWNIRDIHMTETISMLLNQYQPGAKIIVWEHNTHVGDARATEMAGAGMVNVGQLVRERYGSENTYIVGFGTYRGKVIAAPRWGVPLQSMNVPKAIRNSWEWLLHHTEPDDKIILLKYLEDLEFFKKPIGHRAIGVVYNPNFDEGNYVPSVLPERYNAFIFIDETTALVPIE